MSSQRPRGSVGSLDAAISALGFPPWVDISQRRSIADLIPSKRARSGIYVLGFADGERYVGKAVDVVRRLAQHRKNHPDIVAFTFQRIPATEHARRERECIHALEARGLPLRNIAEMSVVLGPRDVDDLVTPTEQERWLTNPAGGGEEDGRVDDPGVRMRYRRRFNSFALLTQASPTIELLSHYLVAAVPFPRRTEQSFWSVSCLPSTGRRIVLARLNINMQEVLTIEEDAVSFHLARTPFEQQLGARWARALRERHIHVSDHSYKPGGHDQINLTCRIQHVPALLDWEIAQLAMRTFNLNLMRKGPCFWGANHCFQLADAALDSTPAWTALRNPIPERAGSRYQRAASARRGPRRRN